MHNLRRLLVTSAFGVAALGLAATAHAYEGGAVDNGGAIAGKVTFKGKAPAATKVPVTKNPEVCGPHKMIQPIIVGAGGALKNAVVYIKKIEKGKEAKPGSLDLNQKDCVYVPHVQAAVKGSKVKLQSKDDILHNVHAKMKEAGRMIFNVGLPGTASAVNKKLRREGLAEITCDAGHTWMLAYIYVFEHPYFAVTGDDGSFEIGDVPAGSYDMVVWHEKLGEQKGKVTVSAGGKATFDVAFK